MTDHPTVRILAGHLSIGEAGYAIIPMAPPVEQTEPATRGAESPRVLPSDSSVIAPGLSVSDSF